MRARTFAARRLPARVAACLFFAALFSLLGCGKSGNAAPAAKPAGMALYSENCAGCHGADGDLGPAPPLNDPMFLRLATRKRLERIVTDGRPGTLMPAFGTARGGPLTPDEVRTLVDEMKTRWGGEKERASKRLPPYAQPKQGADPTAGRRVFDEVCARCHGEGGLGGGMAGPLAVPSFLDLISDTEIRRIVITGRPDLGMPDYRRSGAKAAGIGRPLTEAEIRDIVAFLAAQREKGRGN